MTKKEKLQKILKEFYCDKEDNFLASTVYYRCNNYLTTKDVDILYSNWLGVTLEDEKKFLIAVMTCCKKGFDNAVKFLENATKREMNVMTRFTIFGDGNPR